MRLLADFLRDDSAATAIEYALIAGGIAIVIIASVDAIGLKVKTIFTNVAAGFTP